MHAAVKKRAVGDGRGAVIVEAAAEEAAAAAVRNADAWGAVKADEDEDVDMSAPKKLSEVYDFVAKKGIKDLESLLSHIATNDEGMLTRGGDLTHDIGKLMDRLLPTSKISMIDFISSLSENNSEGIKRVLKMYLNSIERIKNDFTSFRLEKFKPMIYKSDSKSLKSLTEYLKGKSVTRVFLDAQTGNIFNKGFGEGFTFIMSCASFIDGGSKMTQQTIEGYGMTYLEDLTPFTLKHLYPDVVHVLTRLLEDGEYMNHVHINYKGRKLEVSCIDGISVNAVCEAVGFPGVRGEGIAGSTINVASRPATSDDDNHVLILKTMTDWSELVYVLSLLKKGIIVVFITNDWFCLALAALLGLPYVIFTLPSGYIHYYEFNPDFGELSPGEKKIIADKLEEIRTKKYDGDYKKLREEFNKDVNIIKTNLNTQMPFNRVTVPPSIVTKFEKDCANIIKDLDNLYEEYSNSKLPYTDEFLKQNRTLLQSNIIDIIINRLTQQVNKLRITYKAFGNNMQSLLSNKIKDGPDAVIPGLIAVLNDFFNNDIELMRTTLASTLIDTNKFGTWQGKGSWRDIFTSYINNYRPDLDIEIKGPSWDSYINMTTQLQPLDTFIDKITIGAGTGGGGASAGASAGAGGGGASAGVAGGICPGLTPVSGGAGGGPILHYINEATREQYDLECKLITPSKSALAAAAAAAVRAMGDGASGASGAAAAAVRPSRKRPRGPNQGGGARSDPVNDLIYDKLHKYTSKSYDEYRYKGSCARDVKQLLDNLVTEYNSTISNDELATKVFEILKLFEIDAYETNIGEEYRSEMFMLEEMINEITAGTFTLKQFAQYIFLKIFYDDYMMFVTEILSPIHLRVFLLSINKVGDLFTLEELETRLLSPSNVSTNTTSNTYTSSNTPITLTTDQITKILEKYASQHSSSNLAPQKTITAEQITTVLQDHKQELDDILHVPSSNVPSSNVPSSNVTYTPSSVSLTDAQLTQIVNLLYTITNTSSSSSNSSSITGGIHVGQQEITVGQTGGARKTRRRRRRHNRTRKANTAAAARRRRTIRRRK